MAVTAPRSFRVLAGGVNRFVRSAVAFCRRRTAENRKVEQRSKSREGSGNDTDAQLDDGPEANGACAEHKLVRVAVQTQIPQPDDGGTAGTARCQC